MMFTVQGAGGMGIRATRTIIPAASLRLVAAAQPSQSYGALKAAKNEAG